MKLLQHRHVQQKVSISPTFYERLFHTKGFCEAFLKFQFGFVIFWLKVIGTKAACEMLVKLTSGVNFINVLWAAFTCSDPKSTKRQSSCQSFFALSGPESVNAARRTLM